MTGDWTYDDVPDLDGRVIAVTGANSGVGRAATQAFAERGATVVMACRSLDRGREAAAAIRADDPPGDLDVRRCDLADLDAVATFADAFASDYAELHCLCNNAGVMGLPRAETVDGFERQFATNHLGHFALTGHLFDVLVATPGESRVVTQSSNAHGHGSMDFDDLQGADSYGYWTAYEQSKLANVLFALELDRRCRAAGVPVASLVCHPGYADTDLQERMADAAGSLFLRWTTRLTTTLFAQGPRAGARPLVYAATAPDAEGGQYVGPGGFMAMRGAPTVQAPAAAARDEETAARLWDVSTALTGVDYGLPAAVNDSDAQTSPATTSATRSRSNSSSSTP